MSKRSLWSYFKYDEVLLGGRVRETLDFHLPVCMTNDQDLNEYCRTIRSLETIVKEELREYV